MSNIVLHIKINRMPVKHWLYRTPIYDIKVSGKFA